MTHARFGHVNHWEFAPKRNSRLPPGERHFSPREQAGFDMRRSLAVAAGAVLCLATLIAETHAAKLPSWQAIRRADSPAVALIEIKSGFSVANVAGPSGPLPLRIELPTNPTASYSFLMFRNLPAQFRLSAGFGTKTYWAVSLNDIQDLQIIPPESYVGTLALEVLLIKTLGSDPERVTANVTFQPNAGNGRTLTATPSNGGITAALPDAAPAKSFAERLPSDNPGTKPQRQARAVEEPLPNAAPAQPVQMDEADRALMERGDLYLKQGDVASARLIYRQLARKDIAEGAYAMASTYDPEYLNSLGVLGLKPEIEEARKWYEKAHALGSAQAARRLAAMGQR